MKTVKGDRRQPVLRGTAEGGVRGDQVANRVRGACARHGCAVALAALKRREGARQPVAFTLIELLTVISIIAVLAAFTIPVLKGIKRQQYFRTAQAEMEQIETAIERYKAAYGFYPPDNPNGVLTNQLYYELVGTYTNAGNYVTLDGSSQLAMNAVSDFFGVGSFFNSGATNRNNSGEDVRIAQDFLPDLRQNQLATNVAGVEILVSSVDGPDINYQPLPGYTSRVGGNANPWRYNSSNPTNNPGAYELYVQLVIGRTTNLVCNWSKQVQLNSPLP